MGKKRDTEAVENTFYRKHILHNLGKKRDTEALVFSVQTLKDLENLANLYSTHSIGNTFYTTSKALKVPGNLANHPYFLHLRIDWS